MLNIPRSEKALVDQAAQALRQTLEKPPSIAVEAIERDVLLSRRWDVNISARIDILARIRFAGHSYTLLCEIKRNGQPRHVRSASLLLCAQVLILNDPHTVPLLIAPYLSPASRAICEEYEVGFLDLMGNAHIAFNGVFIERAVATPSPSERRGLRSIFSPGAARILRIMLRDPRRPWRVSALAEAAGVSLGHVSNVRRALLDREWVEQGIGGIVLSEPDVLLDTWRDNYTESKGLRLGYYTPLHGKLLDAAAQRVFRLSPYRGRTSFASFSAARWLAPYARTGTDYFYADRSGAAHLCAALNLAPTSKGENVVIRIPEDTGILDDSIEPVPSILCTSEVQTYLDLYAAGERGREAADHLRTERLRWHQ